jgi:glycosyltransferase involved in cell wall biosynthesis
VNVSEQKITLDERVSQSQRVLIISDAAPHRNGVGAYYADLLEEISGHVGKIEMVSPEIVGERWLGGWTLPLPGDATQKVCFPNAFELQKKLRNFQPTVVVIPTPGLFGVLGAVLSKRMNIPVIVGFHTWFEKLAHLYWNKVQGGLTKTYFEMVNKTLFKLADKVLANSSEMVSIAKDNGAEQVELMGTPLSQTLLECDISSAPKRVKKVLFVGRLAAEKNIESIIEASRSCDDIQFTIAGDGPMKESLTVQAAGCTNIRFLGWVARNEIIQLIDDHDVLVLPSKVESFGTVAMEAMVRQRLVIVSNACGIIEWEDLRDGLKVIDPDKNLALTLRECQALSEFELFKFCHLARKVSLEHVKWNRELWLASFNSCNLNAEQTNVQVERLSARLLKSVRG